MKGREKAFLDPVHGFILIDEPWLLRLIDTAEFQRLRRVRQLGASFGTYHGAEHTRFGHSLGALHIMRRILSRLEHVHGPLDEGTVVAAQAAALVHDVGHGPLSHCLEYLLTTQGHEHWTKQIVLDDTELHRALREVDPSLPDEVVAVVAGRGTPRWVGDLVSSQLDVDRMDYLLRDALYTGAEYGRFQLDRIVNTLALHENRIVVQLKGLQAIEEYVLARHFMYWRVYLHKTIRGMELLLRAAVRRARHLAAEGGNHRLPPTPLDVFFRPDKTPSAAEYVAVDDADLFVALKQWTGAEDPVLRDLSRRFLHRRLLKPVFSVPVDDFSDGAVEAARQAVAAEGLDPDYYCLVDSAGNVPYDTYSEPPRRLSEDEGAGGGEARGKTPSGEGEAARAERQPIVVLDPAGRAMEISQRSGLIAGLGRLRMRAANVYVPEGMRTKVRAAIEFAEKTID